LYGTVAIGLILAGRLRELRVVDILTGNIYFQLISIFGLGFFFLLTLILFYPCHNQAVYYGIENSFLDLAPNVVQVRDLFCLYMLIMFSIFIPCFPLKWFVIFCYHTVVVGFLQHSDTSYGVPCNHWDAVSWFLWLPCKALHYQYYH